jgi:hypothetical protein
VNRAGPDPACRAEREIRGRIVDLALSGERVPDDLFASWKEAARGALEAVKAAPADGRKALGEELKALEHEVAALEDARGDTRAQLERALALAASIRSLLWFEDAAAGEPAADPLGHIGEELAWVERSARNLRRWEAGLAEPAERVLERVEALRTALLERRLDRILADHIAGGRSPVDDASIAWTALAECFQLEADIHGREGRLAKGPLVRGEDLAALRTRRARSIEACADALRRAGPVEAFWFLRRAAAELVDRSSAVLSESVAARPEERVPAIRALVERIDAFFRVLPVDRVAILREGFLAAKDREALERDFRSLERERRRAVAALREAEVSLRLERFFGRRKVRLFENAILVLVFGFITLIAVEWRLSEQSPWLPWVHALDAAFCLLFQVDFFVRWGFARWSGSYFLRHFFIESLPALPYGLILHHLGRAGGLAFLGDLRVIVIGRLLALRSVLLILVRALRVAVFLIRGSDRLVERFRWALDRDLILFDAHPVASAPESPLEARLLSAQAECEKTIRSLLAEIPWVERGPVLESHARLLDAASRLSASLPLSFVPRTSPARGELHLQHVIQRLLRWDAARALDAIGSEGVQRAHRWLRFLDSPVLRRAPFIRRLVPAARMKDPPEAVASAVRAIGEMLEGLLSAARFWGDLSGITTGPQILDRVATALVTATTRPAVRLLFFGGLFLLVKGLAGLITAFQQGESHAAVGVLEGASQALFRILGVPLLVLGSACLAVLLTGRWLKRIAGEALDVYLRTADAHSYSLLKAWKLERAREDIGTLHRAVFLPEARLRGVEDVDEAEWRRFLEETMLSDRLLPAWTMPARDQRLAPFHPDREAVTLLYRDFLDGPILSRTDDKTSVQLLGNLVVQDIRLRILRLTKRDLRRLERLDLEKKRLLGLGPYFWFRFITESLAIETSKLVMEYKTSCLPLEQAALAPPAARRRFEEFLLARQGSWEPGVERLASRAARCVGAPVLTHEFSALDFLIVSAEREEAIRRRFGDGVLAALRRDRRGMVRDIFGTHPYHLLPREERILNPYRLYWRYLGGARFVLLPFVAAAGAIGFAWRGVRGGVRLVREVLGKESALRGQPSRVASFEVAVRKLNRMRKPFFMEALRIRAAVDVEYLGLRLPGYERDPRAPTLDEDLDSIGALEGERRPIESLRTAAVRDLRRFRVFLTRKGWLPHGLDDLLREIDPSGLLAPRKGEVLRALVTAYITDHESLRSTLTAREASRELVERALVRTETTGSRLRDYLRLALLPMSRARRRRRRLLREYLDSSEDLRGLAPELRRKVLRSFLSAAPEAERTLALALDVARREGAGEDAALAELRRVAAEHAAWTAKIVTARALQAMTVLDIRCYRDIVWSAGGYAEDAVRGPAPEHAPPAAVPPAAARAT